MINNDQGKMISKEPLYSTVCMSYVEYTSGCLLLWSPHSDIDSYLYIISSGRLVTSYCSHTVPILSHNPYVIVIYLGSATALESDEAESLKHFKSYSFWLKVDYERRYVACMLYTKPEHLVCVIDRS